MATSPPFPLLALLLLLLLMPFLFSLSQAKAATTSTTLKIFHRPSKANLPISSPSSWQTLTSQDTSRLLYLSSLAAAPRPRPRPRRSFAPIASGRQILQTTTYVVRATLGSPPQPLLAAVDTSSDAAWFPCSSCLGCPASSSLFSPNLSSSFRPLPCGSPQCSLVPNPSCPPSSPSCSFNLTYGSSSVRASLCQDSLSLSSDPISSYTFGCLDQVVSTPGASAPAVPPQGLLGLGRGPLSFLSQTKPIYSSVFSYCLPSYKSLNFSGTLRLGPAGQPIRIKTTPLLSNPRRPSLYYVNLVGIRVGRRQLAIPPAALAFDPATGAGTVFDSGTMFTRLVAPAYAAVRDEIRRRMAPRVVGSLGGFDTCYNGVADAAWPAVTLQFAGMNVTLPAENLLIHSSSGSTTCLAMAAAPDNVSSVLNVIATMQQQNHRILYDVANGRIGVAREACTAV